MSSVQGAHFPHARDRVIAATDLEIGVRRGRFSVVQNTEERPTMTSRIKQRLSAPFYLQQEAFPNLEVGGGPAAQTSTLAGFS